MNKVMNLQVAYEVGNLLTNLANINFSRKTLHHVVSLLLSVCVSKAGLIYVTKYLKQYVCKI
jgi:hypothetical protein